MKKLVLIAATLVAMAQGLRAEGKTVYLLDASASTLVASALKNESVTVKVRFPALSGSLDPKSGKVSVTADLKSLVTGDAARDANIQGLFFEVAKKAAYGQASFSWRGKPKDLENMAVDAPKSVTLTGELSLHGSKTKLSGPATLSMLADGSYKASFSGWVVDIKKTKMSKALANLNKLCPQPHRVANEVGLAGELVFKAQ